MIGVVVPDIENPFFTSIIGGVEEVLQAANYILLLANYNESPAKEYELLRTLGAEGAAGIIFTPSNAPNADYQDLVREPAPMVAISRYPEGDDRIYQWSYRHQHRKRAPGRLPGSIRRGGSGTAAGSHCAWRVSSRWRLPRHAGAAEPGQTTDRCFHGK